MNDLNLPKTCEIIFPDVDDPLNFRLIISPEEIGQGYPHDPPIVKCGPMVYYPNMDSDGNVSLSILREEWKPVLTIKSIIYDLLQLFMERFGEVQRGEVRSKEERFSEERFREARRGEVRRGGDVAMTWLVVHWGPLVWAMQDFPALFPCRIICYRPCLSSFCLPCLFPGQPTCFLPLTTTSASASLVPVCSPGLDFSARPRLRCCSSHSPSLQLIDFVRAQSRKNGLFSVSLGLPEFLFARGLNKSHYYGPAFQSAAFGS
ncbi:NEDD8-conjugating enzyme [Takifugu flavidus]|uniref:NEDD8-conjugating enzyme n=1 Tax=Takifugu flavidus TaxID=433684 RepID=A0A5C6NW92_9TELE|nr:NEDD8-conjugating enzyme [Takifugu flavidus]